jgi:hypothetical protein
MLLNFCTSCIVVLNQQQEQNISRQTQSLDTPVKYHQKEVKNCTVIENGRVVVKPIDQVEND